MAICPQKGAIAPLIALLLVVIVVCVAFVVDLGHVHNVKSELQRAVDAAALAGAKQLPDANKVDAVAIATASTNHVDQQAVVIAPEDVILGVWDTEDLTATPSDRFTPTTTNPNAVYVRASRSVDHAFFFFVDATEVVADAIALSAPVNPVTPLALVSCIPLDKILRDPTSLPDSDVCDIRYFIFDNDTDDTAAWTSLTLDVNASSMSDLLDKNNELSRLFEQIVFGLGLNNRGIENTDPKNPASSKCLLRTDNDGTDITCGLGAASDSYEYLAPPSEFKVPPAINVTPAEIPRNAAGVYQPASGFDPMVGYAANKALPRWYTLGDDSGKTEAQKSVLWTNDHFARLWTLDGILLKGENEDPVDFLLRLKGYYINSAGAPAPFNDGRLEGVNGLIKMGLSNVEEIALFGSLYNLDPADKKNEKPIKDKIEAAKLVVSGDKNGPLYFPDFIEIIARSGYPEVGVTNGVIADVMSTFMEKDTVIDAASNLKCTANEPLASDSNANYGQTLRIQAPVIFTGFCESWRSLSLPNDTFNLYYIGLADFYLTRTWNNPAEYDCGDHFVYGGSCPNTFNPPLVSGEFRAVGVPAARAIEGLFQPPIIENSQANSVAKVYLVE